MKEFTTAVADIEAEEAREEKIKALMASEDIGREEAEAKVDEVTAVPFTLDGREMVAFAPTDGQLAFMLATLGRGQTNDQRFAAIVNIMLESLRGDDKDYMESRLLTRNRKDRLPMPILEGIFEYLTEQWFGNPTQPPSDSVSSLPSGGQN